MLVEVCFYLTIPILSPSTSSSKLNSPYSLRVPRPLVKMPQPDIIMVPEVKIVFFCVQHIYTERVTIYKRFNR